MTDFANICCDPYKCPMFDCRVKFVPVDNLLECGLQGWRILSVKETIFYFIHVRKALTISLKVTETQNFLLRHEFLEDL